MPRDSQGNFTNQFNWVEDAANGINIEPDRHQAGDDDQAQGLTDSLDRQGRGGMQAALAMGNNQINQVADGTNSSDVAPISQLQNNTYSISPTETGTANTYVIALTPAITAYTAGLRVAFYATNGNTGACTLQVNGLTPAPALQWQQKDMASGTIGDNTLVIAEYDGNAFQMINVPEVLQPQNGGTGATSIGSAAFADTGTDPTNVPTNADLPASGKQIFTTSGTFDKSILPAQCELIKITAVGAGGGGGGANTNGWRTAGGSSGGVGQKWVDPSTLGATEAVTIGTGGAGGTTSGTPTAGGNGGQTQFGTILTASGGTGGPASNGTGAQGGVSGGPATGGDLNLQGGSSNTYDATSAGQAVVGEGGDTPLGYGSGGRNVTEAGVNYGAGGACGNHTGGDGGAGGDGLVIVEWFGK